MPLNQAALAQVGMAKAQRPDIFEDLSPESTLTKLLEFNQGKEGWDTATKFKEWGLESSDEGGYLGSFVKGVGDAFNPTLYDIPEAVNDSPWTRTGGEVLGSIGSLAVAPWLRGAGWIAKAGRAAKLARGADIGARAVLGGLSGVRDVNRLAAAHFDDPDLAAQVIGGLGGAAMAGTPLDFSTVAKKNALATGATILGGAATQGGAHGIQNKDESFLEGAIGGTLNPVALGMAGLGGLAGYRYPGGMRMSRLDPDAMDDVAAKVGTATTRNVVPPTDTTSVLGGGKVLGGNIPPPPGRSNIQSASATAIENALSARDMQGIEGLGHVPVDDITLGETEKRLKFFDAIRRAEASMKGIEPHGRAFRGTVYSSPVPGVSENFERILGQTDWDAEVKGQLVSKRDMQGGVERLLVVQDDAGTKQLRIPAGASPLPEGLTKADLLPEEVAKEMRIPREVRVYARKVVGDDEPGEYLVYSLADNSPHPLAYWLPEEFLPAMQDSAAAYRKFKEDRARESGLGALANRGSISNPRFAPADPDKLIEVLLATIERLKAGYPGEPQ